MGDRDAAGVQVGEHRLHVAQARAAGGGIAGVADRGGARQALHEVASGEGVVDLAQVALGEEALAVGRGDAAGLLAAVLQGVQAERGDGAGFAHAQDAEHAALEARAVVVGVAGDLPMNELAMNAAHLDFSTWASMPARSEAL